MLLGDTYLNHSMPLMFLFKNSYYSFEGSNGEIAFPSNPSIQSSIDSLFVIFDIKQLQFVQISQWQYKQVTITDEPLVKGTSEEFKLLFFVAYSIHKKLYFILLGYVLPSLMLPRGFSVFLLWWIRNILLIILHQDEKCRAQSNVRTNNERPNSQEIANQKYMDQRNYFDH